MGKKPDLRQQCCLVFLLVLLLTSASDARLSDSDGVIITQANYQGLQAFKHALVDPKRILRSWNDTGIAACSGSWLGIKCARGRVIAIQLPWRGLGGMITDKIGQLSALRKLNLHDNNIGGQIPGTIGFLSNLKGLYLFNNRLSGTIPPSIANCHLLHTLDLSHNLITGTIPNTISSARLYRVNLSYNNLSGVVPVGITQSPALTFLSLAHNGLSGPIPDTWGDGSNTTTAAAAAHQLQILRLDCNSFSGPIPVSLSRLPLLQQVSISNNRISGSIPEEFGSSSSLSKLQSLDLSGNSISGAFPASLSNLSTSLVFLNLDDNLINGQLPETIDGLRNISTLSLKNNRFNGSIPATIGNLTNLSQLDLSDNGFSGPIPSSLIHLSNMTSFNVSNNNLSGPVPLALTKKFNSSSFWGNIQLCGYSPSVPCRPSPPPPSLPPFPSPPSPPAHHRKLSTRYIVLIAVGVALALLLLVCFILLCCLIRKRSALRKKSKEAGGEKQAGGGGATEDAGGKLVHFDGPFVFTADDLLCATAEIMGKSSCGTVYRATLEDGNQVAVKRLREKIAKGQREFEAEVNGIGKIRHQNLLALRAYYLGPKGEKLLVFDYMPKGSLAAFLHARGPDSPISWPTRMNIAMGTARGLSHLHNEMNMIHGNLTTSNILLDEETNPKISDFGLSRLMTSAANSSLITAAGALGYRPPELSKLKKASTKTDVYSLGVVILELLTGKSPGDSMNGVDLPQWVASIVKEEWTNEVFDLELMRDAEGPTGDELLNTLKLALHCVDPTPAVRPEVRQVLQQLEEIKPELAGGGGGSGSGGGDEGAAGPSTTEEGV